MGIETGVMVACMLNDDDGRYEGRVCSEGVLVEI